MDVLLQYFFNTHKFVIFQIIYQAIESILCLNVNWNIKLMDGSINVL
jgi:hypothetical protein